ncbi:T6SS immunity protein Tli4 family protein [Paraburkholderia flagellata]|uniref:T6SS immunity protein Tli4 family protein n=1 Tax=Paraburkholderia flagellata TaxID=2883241 RepID=UPI001EEB36B5|nr:T6SS immunity protein Tli4 family protein [Paraburkholderia flagellata]
MNLRRLALIALLMVPVAACSKHPPPLTEQEKGTVSEITANLKTRCVGRYLIDVPDGALSQGYLTIQGVTFETKRMSVDEFAREMNAHETSLKAKKNMHGYQVLYDYGQVPSAPHSRYFVTLSDLDDTADLGRAIEAYKWDAGYQIKLRIEATDSIHSEFEVRMRGTPYEMKDWKVNDVPEKTRLVLNLAASVRGRPDDEIPGEPGVCFKDGFLPRKAATGEKLDALFALKDRPDVSFDLTTDTDSRELEKNSLPNRLPQIKNDVKDLDGRIIRTGPVTLSGIKADELLVSATTAARVPGHLFRLEANITVSGAMTPYLVLEMNNGGFNSFTADSIEKASLTEGEAIALWDTVSRTLRPRPNAF